MKQHRTSTAGVTALVVAGALVPVGVALVDHRPADTSTAASGTRWPALSGTTGFGGAGLGDGGLGATGSGSGTTAPPSGQGRWGAQGWNGTTQRTAVSGVPLASAKGVVLVDTQLPGGTGAGTGVTLSSSGTVLTNYHVVQGATAVQVIDSTTGRHYAATVVGHDATHDIAVLRLSGASGLSVAVVNETMPDVGAVVTAVGQGGGQGVLYAAQGSVTSTDAHITAGDEADPSSSERLTGLVETSADVVPGYSGGPLLDTAGRVVGIDTAASNGLDPSGYAVPSAQAMSIARQIEAGQRSATVHIGPRAGLGVSVATTDRTTGAGVVGVVPGSAAAGAGITAGSVITAVDGTAVSSAADLTQALGSDYPGTSVRITWTDENGQTHTRTVVLGTSTAA